MYSLALFSVLWLDLIRQLSYQWSTNEQYAYGWFVPLLALGLFWRKWPTRPQVSGLRSQVSGLILPGSFCFLLLLLLFPVRVVYEANPGWPLCSWLLALGVVAIALHAVFLMGGGPWVRHFALPICFILVAVRWPSRIEYNLTNGLMHAVAGVTVHVLNWVDIITTQRGNLIELSTGTVGINTACSGIRSFQSTLMGALFLGELYRLRWPHRLALIGSGVVVAFGLNVVRTFILTWCASDAGIEVVGKWHDPAGLSIFLASFTCLWLLARRLEKHCAALDEAEAPGFASPRISEGEVQSPTSQVQSPGSGVQRPTSKAQSPNSAFQVSGFRSQPLAASLSGFRSQPLTASLSGFSPQPLPSSLSAFRFQPSALRFLQAVGCWSLCILGLNELWYRAHEVTSPGAFHWAVSLPESLPTFARIELARRTSQMLGYNSCVAGRWREPDGSDWRAYFFRWNAGSAQSVIRARQHGPEICLPASGFREISSSSLDYFEVGGLKLPFRRHVYEVEGKVLHVFFCLWQDGDERQPRRPAKFADNRLSAGDRLDLAWRGRRRPGQQTAEIVLSGYSSLHDAEQAVRRRLPQLFRVEPALTQALAVLPARS